MLYPHQLRVRLQDRKARLYRSGFETYLTELRYFLSFLNETHYTRALLSMIDATATIDFDQWVDSGDRWSVRQYPETEVGRANICHEFLKRCGSVEHPRGLISLGFVISTKDSYDDVIRDINEMMVEPLINFVHDQIDDSGNILYLIERFKLKSEWFRRKELHSLYESDTRRGESNLDSELRAALFDGGVDYPFSQPSSPSGVADIVALLESDDPLVLEVKVFDPERERGRRNIRQGFQQILRYAQDYNQNVGYLVIFNCSNKQLVISPETTSDVNFPPCITYGGKTFFIISIDIHPGVASASTESVTDRQVISFDELTER